MGTEFNLSERMIAEIPFEGYFDKRDIQEFISKLKNDIVENNIYTADEIFRIINELAGSQFK